MVIIMITVVVLMAVTMIVLFCRSVDRHSGRNHAHHAGRAYHCSSNDDYCRVAQHDHQFVSLWAQRCVISIIMIVTATIAVIMFIAVLTMVVIAVTIVLTMVVIRVI